MKRMALLGLLGSIILCGCSTPYVMKLSNGVQIESANKPTLKGSTYYYKDAHGKTITIQQSRVLEIVPASEASQENQFAPKTATQKHWWQFWK